MPPPRKKTGFHRVDQNQPSKEIAPRVRLETPETAAAAMAASLKNALALVEKASAHRHGAMTRRTETLSDD